MYRQNKMLKTKIQRNTSYTAETIEMKIRRIVTQNEPISDGAPLIYTDRKNGVQPDYDIRTDRFEIAIDAMDKVTKSHLAKRDSRHKTEEQKIAEEAAKNMGKEGETKTENN